MPLFQNLVTALAVFLLAYGATIRWAFKTKSRSRCAYQQSAIRRAHPRRESNYDEIEGVWTFVFSSLDLIKDGSIQSDKEYYSLFRDSFALYNIGAIVEYWP